MTLIIGIDPGQSGGIAWWTTDIGMSVTPMPETERDIYDTLSHLFELGYEYDSGLKFAYLEQVHSMPKQGVASTFKFGMNYGFLRACLMGNGMPFETVTPQKWQKALGCLSKGDKNVTKRKAQELFPHNKVTHKTADALLICEYGRRLRSNLLKEASLPTKKSTGATRAG